MKKFTTMRPAIPEDAGVLTELALAGKRYWGYPEAWLAAWREVLTFTPEYISAHTVVCAEDEAGRTIGFYTLEEGPDFVQLENLWLATDAIGSGLGRTLFEHAIGEARGRGVKELMIDADPHAEGFYLHMGAVRVGETVSVLTGTERIVPRLRHSLHRTDANG